MAKAGWPGWRLDLGCEPYEPMAALQERLVARRQEEAIEDGIILLEHRPVITLGRRGDPAHVLTPPEVLAQEGIALCRSERGGDATYHGQGQLVAYPIVHLHALGLGASDYMHALEGALIGLLADYGLRAHQRPGVIGVWLGDDKVAALGVRIRRGVAFHGLALNVNPNMDHWRHIIPCGITDGGVTSLARALGQAPPQAEVRERLAQKLADALGLSLRATTLAELGVAWPLQAAVNPQTRRRDDG